MLRTGQALTELLGRPPALASVRVVEAPDARGRQAHPVIQPELKKEGPGAIRHRPARIKIKKRKRNKIEEKWCVVRTAKEEIFRRKSTTAKKGIHSKGKSNHQKPRCLAPNPPHLRRRQTRRRSRTRSLCFSSPTCAPALSAPRLIVKRPVKTRKLVRDFHVFCLEATLNKPL